MWGTNDVQTSLLCTGNELLLPGSHSTVPRNHNKATNITSLSLYIQEICFRCTQTANQALWTQSLILLFWESFRPTQGNPRQSWILDSTPWNPESMARNPESKIAGSQNSPQKFPQFRKPHTIAWSQSFEHNLDKHLYLQRTT